MLVDEVKVTFKAGDGGRGKISFGKKAHSGPDGGNGGKGGDIYIEASSDLSLLNQFHGENIVAAKNGTDGDRNKMTGKFAEDLTVFLPIGSVIQDMDSEEVFELDNVGQKLLLCVGGKGGIGNFDLRSSVNTTPKFDIPPGKGQKRQVNISLRYIADFGLVGLPNSGKSSILNELTNAKAKTGNYDFTTLWANLGVLPDNKILADIPGLTEGASAGKGLGIRFLKHIEKVKVIIHCISADSKDPLKDYRTVRNEMGKYSDNLLTKKEVIILTKHDLVSSKDLEKIKNKIQKLKIKTLITSIYDETSINSLLTLLQTYK